LLLRHTKGLKRLTRRMLPAHWDVQRILAELVGRRPTR
jgi:hypothetical protein